MALLTADEYRTYAGLTEAQAPDARYEALCEAAGAAVEAYCKRSFERATVTEYHTGDGTRYLKLRRRPVVSVTTVHYDRAANYGDTSGAFAADTLLEEGVDYALDPNDTGLLLRVHGTWAEARRRADPDYLARERQPTPGEIRVVYVGGYDPLPADVKLACAQLVTHTARLAQYGGRVISERLGDWSYAFAPTLLAGPAELGSARQLLARYREIPW
jgi:hypothetical protein